jgi:hypothetical protein
MHGICLSGPQQQKQMQIQKQKKTPSPVAWNVRLRAAKAETKKTNEKRRQLTSYPLRNDAGARRPCFEFAYAIRLHNQQKTKIRALDF